MIGNLTPRELRQNRFALLLFVTSQLVPIFVMINIRFMLADTYVSARVDPLVGGLLPTLLLLIAGVVAWGAVPAVKTGTAARVKSRLLLAGVIGVIGFITQIWPLFSHAYDALSPFGEVHLVSVGVGGFYTLLALIVLWSVGVRLGKGSPLRAHYWGVEATAWMFSLNAVGWLALYIALFWL
ncbi:MAG: cytochrome c oxidase subunit 3 [Firmicutes bacterium]|nr:cytochrome c oxidase subunit 3 [Bacillota bacterium]